MEKEKYVFIQIKSISNTPIEKNIMNVFNICI